MAIGRGTVRKTYKATGFFYYGTGGRKETWLITMAEAVKELDIYGDWATDEALFDPTTIKAALMASNQLQTPIAYYKCNTRDAEMPEGRQMSDNESISEPIDDNHP